MAAGEPSSILPTFMVKAGWTRSMLIPTGPKRVMVWEDFSGSGAVEKSGDSLYRKSAMADDTLPMSNKEMRMRVNGFMRMGIQLVIRLT